MKYKINIHSHTIFSDGLNSPYVMALKAKELGFTALVITDHFYGHEYPEFMSIIKMDLLKKACNEAKKVLPVIIGLEIPFMGQEVLIFGSSAIQRILINDKPDFDEMRYLKRHHHCAVVLCHPSSDFHLAVPCVDGYERINGGRDLFSLKDGVIDRDLEGLEGKQEWCNSDAHMADRLDISYNIVGSKIETEGDLIKYIKRGQQHEFYIQS